MAGAGVVLAIAACLPDLAPIPALPSESPPPLSFCGDGVIETLDDGGDAGESCDPGDAGQAVVPGCEGCTFTCPGTMDDAGHCFFGLDASTSIYQANNACGTLGAHVVTLASDREAAIAAAIADGGHWLGLVIANHLPGGPYVPSFGDDAREPGYRRACAGCYAQGVDDAGSFSVYPSDGGGPNCLIAESGRWLQTACEGAGPFATVCEREPVGTRAFFCGGPYCTTLAATAGRKRYVFGPSLRASEAEKFCKAYDDGRLVTFDSREEREQLVREIVARYPPEQQVWIGLSRVDGTFLWDDDAGAGTRPLPWGADQPGPTGTRAFLRIDPKTLFDTQLAYVSDDDKPRIVACQRR